MIDRDRALIERATLTDKRQALTYEEAEKRALRAIHDADGRGMVGRGRNHLHQRVARAILSAARDEGRAEGLGGERAATRQTGWLVEHYASKRGEYLAEWLNGWPAFDDGAPEIWTKDSAKAIRFARREDAEQVIQALGWTEARATEHVWAAPPASQTQEG